MVSEETRAYRGYQSLLLLDQADAASLPEREGLFRQVVLLNMDVAEAIAQGYARRRWSVAALQHVACAGLDKAVRTFDPRQEHDFWRHAKPAVTEEVRRHLHPPEVFRRVPRRFDGLALRMVAVIPELAEELGRSPRASDIADRLQIHIDDVVEVLATDGRPYRRPAAPARDASCL